MDLKDFIEDTSKDWISPPLFRVNVHGTIDAWLIGYDKEEQEIYYSWGTLEAYKQKRLQTSSRKIVVNSSGRNIDEQAFLEANSIFQRKQKEGYSYNEMNGFDKTIFDKEAMLASDFTDKCLKPGDFPVYVQPKLDGIRCRAHQHQDKICLKTRTSEDIMYKNHIRYELQFFISFILEKAKKEFNYTNILCRLDGELYSKEINFDQISGITRKKEVDRNELQIMYFVFDIDFSIDLPYSQREYFIRNCFESFPYQLNYILYVTPCLANSNQEIYNYLQYYEGQGYEGVMIRRSNALYKYGRSSCMYKLKSFQDAEFTVVSAKCGKGKHENCIIWILRTDEGEEFSCCPSDTIDSRIRTYQDFMNDPNKYIGLKYRVKYQTLGDKGIPRFGTGLGFVTDR